MTIFSHMHNLLDWTKRYTHKVAQSSLFSLFPAEQTLWEIVPRWNVLLLRKVAWLLTSCNLQSVSMCCWRWLYFLDSIARSCRTTERSMQHKIIRTDIQGHKGDPPSWAFCLPTVLSHLPQGESSGGQGGNTNCFLFFASNCSLIQQADLERRVSSM